MRSDIIGAEKIIEIFGYWPSFHDAEVVSVALSRGSLTDAPSLTAHIHVFEMTREVSPEGYFILRHHNVVALCFRGVADVKLDGFNHQNALMGLSIKNISSRQLEDIKFEVSFDNAFGLDAAFECREIAVASIESGIPEGSIYTRRANGKK